MGLYLKKIWELLIIPNNIKIDGIANADRFVNFIPFSSPLYFIKPNFFMIHNEIATMMLRMNIPEINFAFNSVKS